MYEGTGRLFVVVMMVVCDLYKRAALIAELFGALDAREDVIMGSGWKERQDEREKEREKGWNGRDRLLRR